VEFDGGIPSRSVALIFRKAWNRKHRDIRNNPQWVRRFVSAPRRRRVKKTYVVPVPKPSLVNLLRIPASLRYQIVELLALALIKDYEAYPTLASLPDTARP
jgi:hypothetical protein